MSEVRSLAEAMNVVRTRTLSAMGKSQTSRYENDAKGDNERRPKDTMHGADLRHFGCRKRQDYPQGCRRLWVIHGRECMLWREHPSRDQTPNPIPPAAGLVQGEAENNQCAAFPFRDSRPALSRRILPIAGL